MTKQQLERFAQVIISRFAPQSNVSANYDLRHNDYENKLNEVRSLIINFPADDIDRQIKEEVADNALQQLKEVYRSYIN